MYIRPWLEALKTSWIPGTRRSVKRLSQQTLPLRVESLEERVVLSAFDLVTVIPNQGVFLSNNAKMYEAPREMTLRFSPGQAIDATSLGAITVTRAGLDGLFDDPATPAVESTDDVLVTLGYVGVGDNTNEVIVRYASTLFDDLYQIRIDATGGNPLVGNPSDTLTPDAGKTYKSFNFELDLGSQVEAVVPQPVIRSLPFSVTNTSSVSDGDLITVNAGPYRYIFEMNLSPNAVVGAGHIGVNYNAGDTPAQVATAIAAQMNSFANTGGNISAVVTGESIEVSGAAFEPTVSFTTPKIDAFSKTNLSIPNPANLADGDLLKLTLSGVNYTFEFNNTNVNNVITSGNIRINYANGATANTLAGLIAGAINGLPINTPTQQVKATQVAGTTNVAVTSLSALGTPALAVTTGLPVFSLSAGKLSQATDTVVVYFNQDQLNSSIAQDPTYYHLIDAATGTVLLPQSVKYQYNQLNGLSAAVLKFSAALSPTTYNLKLGISSEPNGTPATAANVGTVFSAQPFVTNDYLGDGSGSSSDATDADVYQFTTLVAGSTVNFTLDPTGGLDGTIEFLGTGNTPLSSSDSALANGQEILTVGPLGVGTFRVRISSSGGLTTGSYRLQIDSDEVSSTSDDNSSFGTATDLGNLGSSGLSTAGQIEVQSAFVTMPQMPGGSDEPGHRELPSGAFTGFSGPEIGHGTGTDGDPAPPSPTGEQTYSFPTSYGNGLLNQITPEQKEIIRQIFAIFANEAGIQFREVASGGSQTIIVGDIRVLAPTLAADQVGGISGTIINSIFFANDNEFGGGFTSVAFHEIGHVLGLGHSYDVPSIQGGGPTTGPVEQVFTGDNDLIHLLRLYPNNSSDIDLYKFNVTQPGTLSAQTIAERLGVATNLLDTELTLYKEDGSGKRTVIARNDDFFSQDSGLEIEVTPGTFYIGVTSTGNNNYDPSIENSGFGGRSRGQYELQLDFKPAPAVSSNLVDTTGQSLDGDHNGTAGGEYTASFNVAPTIFVDKLAPAGGSGTLAAPYQTISAALAVAAPNSIVRIVGNGGADGDSRTLGDNVPYAIGRDYNGAQTPLSDGGTFQVPQDVTVMIDAGALIKLHGQTVDVGTSSTGNFRMHGVLQVLGTPGNNVTFTSWRDDAKGSVDDGTNGAANGADWGGIVFRQDSDSAMPGEYLNTVNHATIQYGGGQVGVDGGALAVYNAIHLETSRPTITNNTILNNADAAISANPDSFRADDGRIGPDIYGNLVTQNSTNGLFVRIQTALGSGFEMLNVIARFDDTDITHVIAQNLILNGRPAGSLQNPVSARLMIDPGTVVKLSGARIETGTGRSALIAEGTAEDPIRFTSQQDDRYGAGGTFDLKNDGGTQALAGNWSGIFVAQASSASLDNVSISYAGGLSEISGNTDSFNALEVLQGHLRVTNSVFEYNLGGGASTNRGGRGGNDSSTIFVRGAQPVIVDNVFRDNQGNVISINANSMQDVTLPDYGRSTGNVANYSQFDDNYGPLVRLNKFANSPTFALGSTLGMNIRPEELTIESVWDDTDIAHVVRGTITSSEFHTYGGLRLQSSVSGSLVVKLQGATAGFAATGDPLDISDRVGGTVDIIGQPNFPVILTSLADDSVSAGFRPDGFPQFDTNGNNNAGGKSTGSPGDWNSISFDQYSNDRNVAVVLETEPSLTAGNDLNSTVGNPQSLGNLAPNQNSGDENRRLGYEVHGFISPDNPGDVDVYSFTAAPGTEVWIDTDFTSQRLDAMVELLNSGGTVLARSLDSQTETADPATWLGSGLAGTLAGTAGNSQLNSLVKDPTLGTDFYTSNFHDAGFRVVLPGTGTAPITYFVRVRSQPVAGQEAAAIPATGNGLTSGAYQLQVRLKQVDEIPGSTVRYADIRYATNGIVLTGLPAHSPLMGEAAETTVDNDGPLGGQYVGPLLQTDRNTLSVAGSLASSTDVDFFTFTVDYSQVQVVIPGPKFFPTTFDIDWADGLTRPDTVIAVYNSSRDLIFIGRESDIADDQPALGQGQDLDDLSRGTLGRLDPFIGSVNLPAGVAGISETGGVIPGPPPGGLQTYYVAVFSNGRLPTALSAGFTSNATPETQRVRLEPINSIKRMVEDHIGFTGYASQGSNIAPLSGPIFNIDASIPLQTNIRPFTLSDVNLFVTSSSSLFVVDPFNGTTEIDYSNYGNQTFLDIDMRSDGRLYGVRSVPGDSRQGALVELDTGTGGEISANSDGITDVDGDGNTQRFQSNNSASTALAFRRNGTASYDIVFYATADNDDYPSTPAVAGASKLYRGNAANGSAAWAPGNLGATGIVTDAAGTIITQTTGLQLLGGVLWGVSAGNQLYQISQQGAIGNDGGTNVGNPSPLANPNADPTVTPRLVGGTILDFNAILPAGSGTFAGLTDAPQNVENQAYANLLFIITTTGRIFAVDPTAGTAAAALKTVFDRTGNDRVADSTYIDTGVGNPTGLAFSPADYNLWHPTEKRSNDLGHGVNTTSGLAASPSVDNSRVPSTETVSATLGNESMAPGSNEGAGGASFYFGIEEYSSGSFGNYYQYDSGGQYGVKSSVSQMDLAGNALIGSNYNVPGGTAGSLVTNSFNLEGYTTGDKPTLYFNYWLDTEKAGGNSTDSMRDSARVYISTDDGLTWDLIATNNSALSAPDMPDAELPAFYSASKSASPKPNQHVQEMFDTATWRQARVDLNDYVGKPLVKLRFDFSTSGRTGTVVDPVTGKLVPSDDTSNPTFTDDGTNGDGTRNGVTPNSGNSSLAARSNNFEGFYVDDIIVGFAGRGEMVTASTGQGSTFTSVPTDPDPMKTPPLLTGLYQLEIRRGEQYGALVDPPTPKGFVTINPTLDINDRQTNGQTVMIGNSIQTGNTVAVYDGLITKTFEFTNGAPSGTNIAVGIGATKGQTAGNLETAINSAFSGLNTVIAKAVGASVNSDRVDLFGAVSATAIGTPPTTTALADESEGALSNDYPVSFYANSRGAFTTGSDGYYTLNGVLGDSANSGNPDSDFFKVTMTAGQTLTVDLTAIGVPGANYLLTVVDSSFALVASVFNRTLTYTATGNGTYYLGILGDDGVLITSPLNPTFAAPPDPLAAAGNDTFLYKLDLSLQSAGSSLPTPLSVASYVRQGDDNLERQAGQIIIENNQILNVSGTGILVDDDDRFGTVPHPGAALNTPVPNTQRLVTGMYLQNNTIGHFGTSGITITGDANANLGAAIVPFAKVVNNTIVGISTQVSNTLDSVGAAEITAAAQRITFSEPGYPVNTTDPVYNFLAVPGVGDVTVTFGGYFLGQTASGSSLVTLSDTSPTGPLQLDPNAPPTRIAVDLSKPTSPVLTGNPTSNGPISVLFSTPVAAVALDGGVFDAVGSMTLEAFDVNGKSLGKVTNSVVGIQTFGLRATSGLNLIAGISFYANDDELANFSIDNLRFGDAAAIRLASFVGTGILVSQNASPTLLNNAIVRTNTAISIDASSATTEVDANLFQYYASIGQAGNNALIVPNGELLFVEAAKDNYYPAAGSQLIDSSRSGFNDRAAYIAVTGPLGIPKSPIIAPIFDRFGQLRVDDTNQAGPANQPGLGQNPFQDRGSLERADFEGGVVIAAAPRDNDGSGIDLDPNATAIWIDTATPSSPFSILTNFTLQLIDSGIGIDDSSVDTGDFLLLQNGAPLVAGQDYFFTYNQNTNEAIFTSVSTFPLDGRYQIIVDRLGVTDYAGNFLQNNQSVPPTLISTPATAAFSSSLLYFTYIVTNGANDAPVNTAPAAVTVNEDSFLLFSGANSISVTDPDAFLATDGDVTTGANGGRIRVSLSVPIGALTLGDTTNLIADAGGFSGTGTVLDPFIIDGRVDDINTVLSGLIYTPPADFPATVQPTIPLTIKTEDLGKFGAPSPGTTSPQTTTSTVNITVNPVNDVPIFVKGLDQTVLEDAPAQSVSTWATSISAGTANESGQALTFIVTGNSNPGLFSVPPAISATGTLTYTLASNVNGFADISVKLMDDAGTLNGGIDTSAAQTFRINVTPVNDAPSFIKGADQTALEDSGAKTVPGWATTILAGPTNELGQGLTFIITGNTNPALFSVAPAISSTGTLTYTLAANANTFLSGPATITVTLQDNAGTLNGGVDTSAPQTFQIAVTAVNDVPSFTKGPDQIVDGVTLANSVPNWATSILAGPADEVITQNLTFEVIGNTNPSLFAVAGTPAVSATGTLTYTLTATANGQTTITIRLKDDGGTANSGVDTSATQTFTIRVTLNDAPTFTKGPDLTVLEDAPAQTVPNWATAISAGPADEAGQALTFNVIGNSNPSMFLVAPSISSTGTLTYTLAPNANGTALISVTLSDDGGTVNGGQDTSVTQTFNINATPVNDIPSFTKGSNQLVLEDALPQSIGNWATAILAGPPNESAQILDFIVTANSNPGLFSVAPAISPSGTLTYTLAPNINGTASITIKLHDNAGTANAGIDTSATQTFTITATAVNDSPTFIKGNDQTVLEDTPSQTIVGWATAISAGPSDESAQVVTFNVTGNSNPGLFSAGPSISSNGTLTYTLAANANGSANITITLSDTGGTANSGSNTSVSQSFTIAVTPVNDVPSFVRGADQSVLEDAAAQTILGWATSIVAGPPNESGQALQFNVIANTNPGLFSVAPAISPTGTLTYTLAPNANGMANIRFTLSDNGGTLNGGVDTAASQTFNIIASAVNDAPSFVKGADQTVLEDALPQVVPGWATALSAGPANESSQLLSFNVTGNSNPSLFSVAPSISPNGTLSYTLAPNANGTSNITITISDNGDTSGGGVNTSVPQTFSITATSVNDVPTFAKGADQVVLEDAPPQTIANWATGISAGAANESSQVLTFSVVGNSNPGLFSAAPAIGPNGTLTYTLAPNINGTATITVQLKDDGGTANGGVDTSSTQSFNITATAVNDVPSFVKGADQNLLEDAVAQTITGWATAISVGPPNESGQLPTFTVVSNSNPSMFSAAPVIDASGTLTYKLAANANGAATITVKLSDNGGTQNGGVDTSATQSFVITATAVNDVPSFVYAGDQTVLEDAAPQSIANWATQISAGPADESSQLLTFNVTGNSNPSLFSVAPAISSTGTLTYTLAPNANGTANISITLSDSGNNLNGGVNTTTPRTFNITATAVNDVPVFIKGPNQTVIEDASPQTITNWATGISAGAANESSQQLTFVVTANSNPNLFVVAPAIMSNGTLTYTLTPNANGFANITVTLTDKAGTANGGVDTSAPQTFTITATAAPDAPSDVSLSANTVLENQPAGTGIGLFTGVDVDLPNDTLIYSLVSGTGGADKDSFQIVGNQLQTSASFNYEAKSTYFIRVRVTDSTQPSGLSFEKAFTISVLNVNEPATSISTSNNVGTGQPNSILENQPANSVVGTLLASDPDAADTATFALVGGTGSSDNAAFKILNGQLIAIQPFNLEAKGTYSIRVRTTDTAGLGFEMPLTITVGNVNETPTNINLSNSAIVENSAPGTVVGDLTTVDVDAGDTFTYSLVSGAGATDNGKFAISGGQLVVAGPLNYEDPGHAYSIRVQSRDRDGLVTTKVFSITILDVNEASTAVSLSTANIDENKPADTVVGTFNTTDQDSPESFTYSLVAGTGSADNAAFKISGNKLLSAQIFDFETKSIYTVRVRSTDSASHAIEQALTITINDKKDGPIVTLSSSTGVTSGKKEIAVDPTATVVDFDSPNFNNGKIVLAIQLGEQTGDTLSVLNGEFNGEKLKLNAKGDLKLGKTTIATLTGGESGVPLTIQFQGATSKELFQVVLQHASFKGKPFAAPRIVSVQAFDELGIGGNVATRNITVN